MSSKKVLLSKLKKDIREKKLAKERQAMSTTSSSTGLMVETPRRTEAPPQLEPSYEERRKHFMETLRISVENNEPRQVIQDQIRIHISSFPEDQSFYRLISLDDAELATFLSQVKDKSSMSTYLVDFVRQLESDKRQDRFSSLKSNLRSLSPLEKTYETLIRLDPYVFASLEFQSSYNERLVPSLIQDVLERDSYWMLPQEVEKFMYNHRYDYTILYLENEAYSSDEKQQFTVQAIKNEFESVRSHQLYLKILHLIDDRVTNFQRPLQAIVYRSIQDKKMVPAFKNYMELMLDVIINQVSGDALQKYFSTKVRYEKFLQSVYPSLQSRDTYQTLLHDRCVEEFEQPFLFRNAYRIKWREYLSIVKKHVVSPVTSIEMQLYEATQKNADERISDILVYLRQHEQDPSALDTTYLNTLIERFRLTKPLKEQATLKKLQDLPPKQLETTLKMLQSDEYVEAFSQSSLFDTIQQQEPYKDVQFPKPRNYIEFQLQEEEMIQRTRPFLRQFDHVSIGYIDDISMYVMKPDGESKTYFVPNDKFFQDLVDPGIFKVQQGEVFVMNDLKMTVANMTIAGNRMIQNEETFFMMSRFIQQQKTLETIMSPIGYFDYFVQTPILNHQSEFMNTFRSQNEKMIYSYMVRAFDEDDMSNNSAVMGIAKQMEESIHTYARTLGDYSLALSSIVSLLHSTTTSLSSYSSFFKECVCKTRLNTENIGRLFRSDTDIDIVLRVLFPEVFYTDSEKSSTSLKKMFMEERRSCHRRIMLDAYSIQFPTRRLPYLPIIIESYDKGVIGTITIPDDYISEILPHELRELYFLSDATQDAAFEKANQEILQETPSDESFHEQEIESVNDPLVSFLDVAMTELDTMLSIRV